MATTQDPGPRMERTGETIAGRHDETKWAPLTTEFWAMLGLIVAILIAAAVSDSLDDVRVWTLVTIIGAAYIGSRGLAKMGLPRCPNQGEASVVALAPATAGAAYCEELVHLGGVVSSKSGWPPSYLFRRVVGCERIGPAARFKLDDHVVERLQDHVLTFGLPPRCDGLPLGEKRRNLLVDGALHESVVASVKGLKLRSA